MLMSAQFFPDIIKGMIAMHALLTRLAKLDQGRVFEVRFDEVWLSTKTGPL